LHFKVDAHKKKLSNLKEKYQQYEDNEVADSMNGSNGSLYSATFDNSEFVSLHQIELDENNEIPSNVSKWSEYLQKEQQSINNMRTRITTQKKSVRQKQRKLEALKNQWKKERDKLKLMALDTNYSDNKQQFNSIKNVLKKKKSDLDHEVNQINEQILEIRESSQLLNRKESRLQTLEIEYLRTQNNHSNNNNNNDLLKTLQSNESIPLIPQPPNYPLSQQIIYDTSQPNKQQTDIFDLQSLHKNTQNIHNTINSNEIQQRLMIHSNSIGQHAVDSVISKYVKHNRHTQRTINHHKSWLKSFQNELRNVSHSIGHDASYKKRRESRHTLPRHTNHNTKDGNGEVVIRVKIEK